MIRPMSEIKLVVPTETLCLADMSLQGMQVSLWMVMMSTWDAGQGLSTKRGRKGTDLATFEFSEFELESASTSESL